jgi:hypothetical protein
MASGAVDLARRLEEGHAVVRSAFNHIVDEGFRAVLDRESEKQVMPFLLQFLEAQVMNAVEVHIGSRFIAL